MATIQSNTKSKSVQVYLPLELHRACSLIKAHKLMTGEEEPSFAQLIVEMVTEAAKLPKYRQATTFYKESSK